ncbi:uncharacterized protein LOC142532485 [Primulina tabacum]|uniref:uncharacterized protein LOC142532485 n=1 Tax=Primulina tabacum TaxID=48773 RepID=UPI003F5A9A91
MRKTLVFYRGRAPHGQKTDWIMHEYRLEVNPYHHDQDPQSTTTNEDGWVVCRVFKKKNLLKDGDSTGNTSEAPLNMSTATTSFTSSCNLQSRSLLTNSDHMIINMNQYNVQQQQEVELGSDPNYSLAVPVSATSPLNQYPQIEFLNSISNNQNKQLMMSTSNHYKDHGCENIVHASAAADSIGYLQVHCMHPSLIERCAQSSRQATAASKSDYNINKNEWDLLVIATFNAHHHDHNEVSPKRHVFQGTIDPASSGIDKNNQLTPRSEMDFWAYGN